MLIPLSPRFTKISPELAKTLSTPEELVLNPNLKAGSVPPPKLVKEIPPVFVDSTLNVPSTAVPILLVELLSILIAEASVEVLVKVNEPGLKLLCIDTAIPRPEVVSEPPFKVIVPDPALMSFTSKVTIELCLVVPTEVPAPAR